MTMYRTFFEGLQNGKLLFDRFLLKEVLNAHGTVALLHVHDTENAFRSLALKVLMRTGTAEDLLSHRFRTEYERSHTLRHPHVVQSYDFFEDATLLAFTMEYMDQGSVACRLAHGCQQPIREVLQTLIRISDAVNAVHLCGFTHRDIKPENILFARSSGAKLADFGISEPIEAGGAGEDEVILGTIDYLSPEYIRSGYFDQRSDIFSLGLVGYEMLTGFLPFRRQPPLERLMRRANERLPHVSLLRPDCPPLLGQTLMRTLHLAPQKRLQSARELLFLLRESLSEAALLALFSSKNQEDDKLHH